MAPADPLEICQALVRDGNLGALTIDAIEACATISNPCDARFTVCEGFRNAHDLAGHDIVMCDSMATH